MTLKTFQNLINQLSLDYSIIVSFIQVDLKFESAEGSKGSMFYLKSLFVFF